jgi:3-hydroxyacyl-CoA dehydrogenase
MIIGIVGYGKMGSGIFKLISRESDVIYVLMRSEDKAKECERRFLKTLERSVKRGTLTEDEFLRKKQSLSFTHRWEDLESAELVIETVVEAEKVKTGVFRTLEGVVGRNTVLVSNTSSISIEKLAGVLKHRDRFCGLHFFYPVMLIDLVEIIRWKSTPNEVIDYLKAFCRSIGKKPIVVVDGPGSVISAALVNCYIETLYILEEGLALPSEVDKLAKRLFYIGPCESMDVLGIDFLIEAIERVAAPGSRAYRGWRGRPQREILEEDAGGREGFFVPYLFGKLTSEGRLGRKVSKGIYLYERERPLDDKQAFYVNPECFSPCRNTRECQDLIAKRLLYSVFNGALYSLKRGMSSIEELDLGLKEALQMKAGPFSMMKTIGEERLREDFSLLTRNVGKRFGQTEFDFLHSFTPSPPSL